MQNPINPYRNPNYESVTTKNSPAYKIFLQQNSKWLYGELKSDVNKIVKEYINTIPEVTFYEFNIDKSFVINVKKLKEKRNGSWFNFMISSIPFEILTIDENHKLHLPEDYDLESGYCQSFIIDDLEAESEQEALNYFLENIYSQYPIENIYKCHYPKENYSSAYGQSLLPVELIVTEKIPNCSEQKGIQSATSSNYTSTECFDLLYFLNQEKVKLSNFADKIIEIFGHTTCNFVSSKWVNLIKNQKDRHNSYLARISAYIELNAKSIKNNLNNLNKLEALNLKSTELLNLSEKHSTLNLKEDYLKLELELISSY